MKGFSIDWIPAQGRYDGKIPRFTRNDNYLLDTGIRQYDEKVRLDSRFRGKDEQSYTGLGKSEEPIK